MRIARRLFCTLIMISCLLFWGESILVWLFGIAISLSVDAIFTPKGVDVDFFSMDYDINSHTKLRFKYVYVLVGSISLILLGCTFPFASYQYNSGDAGGYVSAILLVISIFPFSIFGLSLYFYKGQSAYDVIVSAGSIPVEAFFIEAIKSKKISEVVFNSIRIVVGLTFLIPFSYFIRHGLMNVTYLNVMSSLMMSLFFSAGLSMILLSMLRLGRMDFVQ